MKLIAVVVLLVGCAPAAAQDSPLNIRIGAQIGQLIIQNDSLLLQAEQLQAQLSAAQAQLSAAQARVRELEEKYEPKADSEK